MCISIKVNSFVLQASKVTVQSLFQESPPNGLAFHVYLPKRTLLNQGALCPKKPQKYILSLSPSATMKKPAIFTLSPEYNSSNLNIFAFQNSSHLSPNANANQLSTSRQSPGINLLNQRTLCPGDLNSYHRGSLPPVLPSNMPPFQYLSPEYNYTHLCILLKWKFLKSSLSRQHHPPKMIFIQNFLFQEHPIVWQWILSKTCPFKTITSSQNCQKSVISRTLHLPLLNEKLQLYFPCNCHICARNPTCPSNVTFMPHMH